MAKMSEENANNNRTKKKYYDNVDSNVMTNYH